MIRISPRALMAHYGLEPGSPMARVVVRVWHSSFLRELIEVDWSDRPTVKGERRDKLAPFCVHTDGNNKDQRKVIKGLDRTTWWFVARRFPKLGDGFL